MDQRQYPPGRLLIRPTQGRVRGGATRSTVFLNSFYKGGSGDKAFCLLPSTGCKEFWRSASDPREDWSDDRYKTDLLGVGRKAGTWVRRLLEMINAAGMMWLQKWQFYKSLQVKKENEQEICSLRFSIGRCLIHYLSFENKAELSRASSSGMRKGIPGRMFVVLEKGLPVHWPVLCVHFSSQVTDLVEALILKANLIDISQWAIFLLFNFVMNYFSEVLYCKWKT